MTELYGALVVACAASAGVAAIAAVGYCLWLAFLRNGAKAQARTLDARVRFEAMWGIVLAAPLVLYLLAGAAEPGLWLIASVGLVALALAILAIPIVAWRGARLPRGVRWIPATVAFATAPAFVVGVAVSTGDLAGALFAFFVTGFAIGYFADCAVAVRFARAIGRRDRAAAQNPDERWDLQPTLVEQSQ